ncbi:MAG: sterol desaturase family protein [Pirellulales bacterium]|nr:sterol desaturase family protein [Pirellulales bacterium]
MMHVWVSPLLAMAVITVLNRLLAPYRIEFVSSWVAGLPGLVQIALAFCCLDLSDYWTHRISHTVPWLWRFHAVHHSSRHLDWLASRRGHPIDITFATAVSSTLATLFGLDAIEMGIAILLIEYWGFVIHANVSWRLKWLDRLWVTPEYHHWHHVRDRAAYDKNFGNTLVLWDLLFGSYYMPQDRRPADYGIDYDLPTDYFGQIVDPFLPRRKAAAPTRENEPTSAGSETSATPPPTEAEAFQRQPVAAGRSA